MARAVRSTFRMNSPSTVGQKPVFNMINPDLRRDVPLNMINPDLERGGVPLDMISPDLKAGWDRFAGAGSTTAPGTVGAPQEQFRPGPRLGEVKNGTAELSRGHSGAGVFQVQDQLRRSGEKVAVDGLYGPKTEQAVKDFQGKHGLEPSGVVDQATAKALEAAAGPAPKPSPKPSPKPNGGGGGGGGGGTIQPPTPKPEIQPPSPQDLMHSSMAKMYNTTSSKLESGYKKGQDPAIDAAVQKILSMEADNPPGMPTEKSGPQFDHATAYSRFQVAARNAGF